MSDLYLQHHGILGQRWGVRRFQNGDGSLTQEGRKRYYESMHKDANSLYDMVKDMSDPYDSVGDNVFNARSRLSLEVKK